MPLTTILWGRLCSEIMTDPKSPRKIHGWVGIWTWIFNVKIRLPNHYTISSQTYISDHGIHRSQWPPFPGSSRQCHVGFHIILTSSYAIQDSGIQESHEELDATTSWVPCEFTGHSLGTTAVHNPGSPLHQYTSLMNSYHYLLSDSWPTDPCCITWEQKYKVYCYHTQPRKMEQNKGHYSNGNIGCAATIHSRTILILKNLLH